MPIPAIPIKSQNATGMYIEHPVDTITALNESAKATSSDFRLSQFEGRTAKVSSDSIAVLPTG